MIELFLSAGIGLFVALVVGAVIFSFLIGLVLLPLKLGFMLLKGLFVGLLAIPMAAMGFALFVGLMAVGCAIGVVLLILSAVF
jgi:hypothetical protein